MRVLDREEPDPGLLGPPSPQRPCLGRHLLEPWWVPLALPKGAPTHPQKHKIMYRTTGNGQIITGDFDGTAKRWGRSGEATPGTSASVCGLGGV